MVEQLRSEFMSERFVEEMRVNKIGYVLAEQRMYGYVKGLMGEMMEKVGVEVVRLPFDKKKDD